MLTVTIGMAPRRIYDQPLQDGMRKSINTQAK